MDKSWLDLDRYDKRYYDGIEDFIDFVKRNTVEPFHLCPCRRCKMYKGRIHTVDEMRRHLLLNGMIPSYRNWTSHGEPPDAPSVYSLRQQYIREGNRGSTSTSHIDHTFQIIDNAFPFLDRDGMETENACDDQNVKEAYEKYQELLREAQTPVYPNCKKSVLETILKLMQLKVENQWSDKSFDGLLKVITGDLLPEENNYPKRYRDVKKLLKNLGMSYEVIHGCEYGCVLYYKEFEELEHCPVCSEPRYIGNSKTPSRVVRYFPLTPRLQRLYMSPDIAKHMRWHGERVENDDEIRHPADGEAWKKFDLDFPNFGAEIRNVRLGLATDGFSPYGISGVCHSTWPIVVVPYNLPRHLYHGHF